MRKITKWFRVRGRDERTNLSEHEVTLGELHEKIFSTEGVIELGLEVLNLSFRVLKLDERGLVLG